MLTKEEVGRICSRINKGEKLEDISRELNVRDCYIKKLIKDYGIKYSNILRAYYAEGFEDNARYYEEIMKRSKVFDEIEEIWLNRYYGLGKDYDGMIEEDWLDNEKKTFKISLSKELYKELQEIAKENATDIDYIVERALLKNLERERRTTTKKANKIYIKSLAELLIENETIEGELTKKQEEKFFKEIENNIKRKGFLVEPLTYRDLLNDCDIYEKSYLLDNGYTKENIEEIELLEKELDLEFPLTDHYQYKTNDNFKDMSYEDIKNRLRRLYQS